MRKFAFTLAALMSVMTALTACGADETVGGDTTHTPSGDTTAPAEEAYVYPDIDFSGETFTILNTAQDYNFYSALDFEEATGDALDDAIFARNRFVEEKFNCVLEINEEYKLENANKAFEAAVLAGDDVYDVAFLREIWMASQLTQGMLQDLQDVENFHFEEPWWDTAAYEEVRFGESQAAYYAYTDISFCDFEGTLCIFFNENMMEDYGIKLPYDLVREGKWTFEEYGKIMTAGANLNGQDSFAWDQNGNATYGLATWGPGPEALFYGMEHSIIEKDANGNPSLSAFDDPYVSAMQKVITKLSNDGEYIDANTPANGCHYEAMLKNGRALTIISQLKAANGYRDMEDNYGIVPIPKADASQDRYYCLRSYSYVMSIPVTNTNLEETAAIMDALSYVNYTTVMDDFYHGRVSQKSLRNDDSIEMLGIIQQSRVIDLGAAYGWSTNITTVLKNAVNAKSTDIMSGLASYRESIEANIKSVVEQLSK